MFWKIYSKISWVFFQNNSVLKNCCTCSGLLSCPVRKQLTVVLNFISALCFFKTFLQPFPGVFPEENLSSFLTSAFDVEHHYSRIELLMSFVLEFKLFSVSPKHSYRPTEKNSGGRSPKTKLGKFCPPYVKAFFFLRCCVTSGSLLCHRNFPYVTDLLRKYIFNFWRHPA